MPLPALRMAILIGIGAGILGAQTAVVLRTSPLPTPGDIAALESHLLDNPDDLEAQSQILQVYAPHGTGPVDPARQALRLQHILYLVQRHPEAPVSASHAAYVYRAGFPQANAADHEALRQAWLDAAQAHSKDSAVTLNAVRFLAVEDAGDAEQVLKRAMAAEPENRELAAHLGFLYAIELLGLPSLDRGARPGISGRERSDLAMQELEQSSNAIVLAAAGTVLANLTKAMNVDAIDGTMLNFANDLTARARRLAPNDADIQGPMPLITYFVAAQR